jgi:hypothetical protein
MDFLQKCFFGVFEFSLPRNALKRTKQKSRKTKVGWWVGLRFSKCTGGSVDFVLAGPSYLPDIRRFQKKLCSAPCAYVRYCSTTSHYPLTKELIQGALKGRDGGYVRTYIFWQKKTPLVF